MFRNSTDIPIHFIWIGKPMPKVIVQCFMTLVDTYKKNPIYYWTEPSTHDFMIDRLLTSMPNVIVKDVHAFDNHRIFTDCTYPGQQRIIKPGMRFDVKCDLYRLCILELYGGCYLDADYYHVADYTPELIKHEAALGQCNREGLHGNGLMYVNRPSHPWIEDCIDRCISYPNFVFHRACYCGPNAAYKTRNENKDHYTIYSVPFDLFFTYTWEEMERKCFDSIMANKIPDIEIPKQSRYAVHLWYDLIREWCTDEGISDIPFDFIESE